MYAFILDQTLEERISDFIRGLGVRYHFLNFSDKILEKGKLEFDTRVRMGKEGKNCLRRHSKAKERKGIVTQYLLWRCKGMSLGHGKLNSKFGLDLTDFGRAILQNPDMVTVSAKILKLSTEVRTKKDPKKGNIKYCTWISNPVANMDRYLPEVESCQLSRGTKAGNLPKLTTTLRFPEMPDPGWYAYRIHILPKNEAFQIPNWVEGWSTDRDDIPENANKTLNLENVILCIFGNAPIKRRDFAEFFAVVNYRYR